MPAGCIIQPLSVDMILRHYLHKTKLVYVFLLTGIANNACVHLDFFLDHLGVLDHECKWDTLSVTAYNKALKSNLSNVTK